MKITYHVIGVLENDVIVDQHVSAADVMAAIGSFEAGACFQGKVTALRLPCADVAAYNRQVALAKDEAKAFVATRATKNDEAAEYRAKPKQMRLL